jgi:hypothetical protein
MGTDREPHYLQVAAAGLNAEVFAHFPHSNDIQFLLSGPYTNDH